MRKRHRKALFRACAAASLAALLCACVGGEPYREHVVPGGDPEAGRLILAARGCGTCHTVPGVRDARGMVGPPLTDWAKRVYIAGNLLNTPENLIRWIQSPDSIEPGTAMPNLSVTRAEAAHIAAYLYTLGDPFPLGPPHPIPARALRALMPGHSSGGDGGR